MARVVGPGPSSAGDTAAAPGSDASLARSTAAMTLLTAVSRLTGFVRVLVVAAVLGTTFLGNTYQSANTVPNVLFELFAAGVLQAVLIPSLVELLDQGDQREAEHIAGSILGLATVLLAGLAVVGIVAAPWVMRGLVSGVSDPAVRDREIGLGTVFLWFFLPQVVLYATGLVATGVLHAHDRFALPAFAPVVNNVVVTASYLLFAWMLHGDDPTLDLTGAQTAVLAGGTTLAVLAFCSVPVIGVRRLGFSLRPRLDHRHPRVRALARRGGWAAVFLAMSQILLLAVLVLANGIEGGVVAYQVGFTFFLLPHALFALPVLTALFPQLSRHAAGTDWPGFARSVGRGVRAIAFFVLPATAALVVLAQPLARALLFGASSGDGVQQVAAATAGFAPGLLGYGALLFLTRAFYATGDTRTPALVNTGVTAVAVALMAGGFALAEGDGRIAALALGHSIAHLGGAAVLYALLRSRLGPSARPRLTRQVGLSAASAAAAGVAMWLVQQPFDVHRRALAVLAVAAAGAVGGVVYLGAQAAGGGPRPATLVRLLRGRGVGA